MVPLKKGGKWEMIPQTLYLCKLKRNERNDLASLKEWATVVEKAISEHEKNSSPPLKLKFDSDITSTLDDYCFDEENRNDFLLPVDSILQAYDVVELVTKQYKTAFSSSSSLENNPFLLSTQTWQKYFTYLNVDHIIEMFELYFSDHDDDVEGNKEKEEVSMIDEAKEPSSSEAVVAENYKDTKKENGQVLNDNHDVHMKEDSTQPQTLQTLN